MTKWIIIIATLLALTLLGYSMNKSIDKFSSDKLKVKKKKGKNKYLPKVKDKF